MSCGVELCPSGTVGNVTMRGGNRVSSKKYGGGGCGCMMRRQGGGGACPAGQLRMLGTYPEVIRATPGPMDGWGTIKGGGCGCGNKAFGFIKGGYRATQRNRKYLKKYKSGKSIGFTMRSSLKAKGLIPRANGTYKVSKKYSRRSVTHAALQHSRRG